MRVVIETKAGKKIAEIILYEGDVRIRIEHSETEHLEFAEEERPRSEHLVAEEKPVETGKAEEGVKPGEESEEESEIELEVEKKEEEEETEIIAPTVEEEEESEEEGESGVDNAFEELNKLFS